MRCRENSRDCGTCLALSRLPRQCAGHGWPCPHTTPGSGRSRPVQKSETPEKWGSQGPSGPPSAAFFASCNALVYHQTIPSHVASCCRQPYQTAQEGHSESHSPQTLGRCIGGGIESSATHGSAGPACPDITPSNHRTAGRGRLLQGTQGMSRAHDSDHGHDTVTIF